MESWGTLTLTKWPTVKAVDFNDLVKDYGATFFIEALRRYIVLSKHTGPSLTRAQLEEQIVYANIPFTSVSVHHKLKFTSIANSGPSKFHTLDTIHGRPKKLSRQKALIPARFDTVLLDINGGETGTRLQGMCLLLLYFYEADQYKDHQVGQV